MRARAIAILFIVSTAVLPVIAADGPHPICPLVLHQIEVESEERVLDVELARSEADAAGSIFDLVDALWKDKAIERIVYLAARHDRDVTRIEVQRRELLLKRHEAELAQYAAVCSSASTDVKELAEARRRYLQADCHRIGKDLAIAEADLDFYQEVLVGMRDLRENGAATRQAVIRAERDVETARRRIASNKARVDACVESGAASSEER